MILPCISACVPLHIDEGPPRHNTFSVVGLPLSLFCPPPPHRRYAADSRAFSAPPPVTLAVRGRFLMGGLLCCRVCVSFNLSASRVPGSIARPLEVWEWVLSSRTFDSWSSS